VATDEDVRHRDVSAEVVKKPAEQAGPAEKHTEERTPTCKDL